MKEKEPQNLSDNENFSRKAAQSAADFRLKQFMQEDYPSRVLNSAARLEGKLCEIVFLIRQIERGELTSKYPVEKIQERLNKFNQRVSELESE